MNNSNYISLVDLDKDQLLNQSKVFCMFPWLHLNVTPKGDMYPCCSNDYTRPFTNTKEMSLDDAFNHDFMKQLRLNMLNDVPSNICTFCYDHEKAGPNSFRKYSNEKFGQHFEESMKMTHQDGHVDQFKMRYFDIRFSNICNFKCRSCGAEFSSQWALEDKKTWNKDAPVILHVDHHKGDVLSEILDQVQHIDLAYFAGGEPLITEEHYLILEELIRKGKTDTVLRYNTNASTLNYKNYDILDLWKHFDNIELSCSIDHYGERAELMRHGTNWGKVENNLRTFRETPGVKFQLNTVFSIMNFLTLTEFYEYMHNAGLLDYKADWWNTLYLAANPKYLSAQALPNELKKLASEKILNKYTEGNATHRNGRDAVAFANLADTWHENKQDFFHNIYRLDSIRGEDFFKTFPELSSLRDI
jgi:MoaA/NifB/PqqE/SkfB family radical SAM enzyme